MDFFKSVVNWYHGEPAGEPAGEPVGEPVEERFTLPNGLHLVVKRGDITKETAGGVVVGEDEDFTAKGAIAQALLKAGGEDYKTYRDQLREIVKNDRTLFLIYSCPAGEYLQYKYILHAMTSFNRKLPKNWVGHLKALFFEMGRVAEEKALPNLVTPLLGTGKAAMPLDVSVQAAIHGLSMLQPRALKQVTILEYDRKKAETIRDNIRRILASNGTSTDPAQSNGVKGGRRAGLTGGWTESGTERTRSFSSYDIISFPGENERSRMPDGKMVVSTKPQLQLQGFPGCGTILIEYSFPNGTQGPHHPAPGQPYKGTFRRAYLPDNQEGQRLLELLKKAFDSKLTFQLVQSGPDQEWGVEFADIPHKTSLRGGPKGHGFPDPSYMVTVRTALAEHRLYFESPNAEN